jgi:hypothetical protein
MSDEYDSWLENALGVDVSSYVGGVTIEPSGGSQQYATGLDISPDPPGGYATGLDINPNSSGGPPYYALGEDSDPADIDAGNFAASLTGVPDDSGAPTSSGAVIAEDKIPYVLGETAIEEVEVEGEPEEDSSQEGKQDGGEQGGQQGGEQGGGQQDGDEKGADEEPQQHEQITAGLRTAYGQRVSYYIQDATTLRMLVNGDQYPGGEVIWLTFASTHGGNGSCYYARDSYPEGGGRVGPTLALVRDGQITNMIN